MSEETKQASQSEPEEDGFLAILVIERAPQNKWEYNPIFQLGQVVATPGAIAELDGPDMIDLLIAHADMEQGELGNEDHQLNVLAVKDGSRIVSKFKVRSTSFYVITEADRSVTTVQLPEEY